MKATKLIRKLEAMVELFGDKDIEVNAPEGGDSIIASEVRAWGEDMEYATPDNEASVFHIA